MGNSIDYDKIRFVKEREPIKYLLEIYVNEFNIEIIKKELQLLLLKENNRGIDYFINDIVNVLTYIESTENSEMLEQVDGYLFNRLNGTMPYLAIINTSAPKKRREKNVSNDGFYYKYNL